jgi:hypothetical protein
MFFDRGVVEGPAVSFRGMPLFDILGGGKILSKRVLERG